MPTRGLPSVEQKIDADYSAAVRHTDEYIAKTREATSAFGDLMGKIREYNDRLNDVNPPAIAREFSEQMDAVRKLKEETQGLTAATGELKNANDSIDNSAAQKFKAQADALSEAARNVELYAASIKRMQADTLSNAADAVDAYTAKVLGSADAHKALQREIRATAGEVSRASALGFAAAASGLQQAQAAKTLIVAGGNQQFANTLMQLQRQGNAGMTAALLQLQQGGFGAGGVTPALVAAMHGGGGGGGGFAAAAAAAAAFGGGGGGFGGGGGPGAGPALAAFGTVAGFVRRWLPVAHWVMMLSNEILATAGPAAVAAGMAGLVGMQGGEQVKQRLSAVRAVGEAYYPIYGQSAGAILGVGNQLQQYQNQYTGGVYGLYGAALNVLGSKSGGQLLQLGGNTIGMFDRAAANLVQSFNSGLGQSLTSLVSGGTGYLQQFGDIAGNIGKTVLNVAPNLPGVGGDLLSILQSGTGLASKITGGAGGWLGLPLAAEAAARWGLPMAGGLATMLGGGLQGGGLAALAEKMRLGTAGLTAQDVADLSKMTGMKLGPDLIGAGGTGMAGLLQKGGLALGGLTAPAIGGLGALTYLLGKGFTYQSPAQQQMGSQLAALQQMQPLQFMQAFPGQMADWAKTAYTTPSAGWGFAATPSPPPMTIMNLLKGNTGAQNAIKQATGYMDNGLRQMFAGMFQGHFEKSWQGLLMAVKSIPWTLGIAAPPPTDYQKAQQQMASAAGTYVNTLGSMGQLQKAWAGFGGGAISGANAFSLASMANLNLAHGFTPQQAQQFANFYRGFGAMMPTGGAVGTAVSAYQASQGLQASQIAGVNSALDQMTQIMSGGAAGTGALLSMLGGTPVTSRRGGLQFAAPPAMNAMGRALASFITPQGAAAWTTFASTSQPSLISQTQSNLDWLRQSMLLGAVGKGQGTEMGAFWLQQLLPMAQKSPAARAMVASLGSQLGITQVGQSTAQINKEINQAAGGADQFQKNMTKATVGLANIPADAKSFIQNMTSDASANAAAKAATAMSSFQDSIKGASFSVPALNSWVKTMREQFAGTGMTGAQTQSAIGAVITSAMQKVQGVTPQMISAALQAASPGAQNVSRILAMAHAGGVSGIGPAISASMQALKPFAGTASIKVILQGLASVQAQLSSLRGKTLTVDVQAKGVAAVAAAVNAIRGKTVTIEVIQHFTTIGSSVTGLGSVRTISGTGVVGSLGGRTGQTGFLVPGYGGGDTYPAMLEGGEAVVPKHLTPAIAPFLAANKVPGFASGGIIGGISMPGLQLMIRDIAGGVIGPAVADLMHSISSMLGKMSGPFAFHGPFGGAGGSGSGTPRQGPPPGMPGPFPISGPTLPSRSAASARQEAAYAKSVTASIISGFSLQGIDTATTTVVDSMQQYVTSIKDFSKDIKTLGAEGLNKTLLKQLIAAGPVTGDALAKSILGGMKQQIAQQQVAGLNLGGMDVTPGTGQGTVQDQMQSYLTSMKSFGADFGTLSKGGLSKGMLQQIMAAGPVQGDALAQSILSGPGGIKGANQLWNQINQQAQSIGAIGAPALGGMGVKNVNQLWSQLNKAAGGAGAAAAQAVFGFPLHGKTVKAGVTANIAPVHQLQAAIDGLHGKTVDVHVNVSTSGSGGDIKLSPQQLSELGAQIQSWMLKQARRNQRTGLKSRNKGS